MKAVSFIDKCAEFRTNRMMDIKSLHYLFSKVGTRKTGQIVNCNSIPHQIEEQ